MLHFLGWAMIALLEHLNPSVMEAQQLLGFFNIPLKTNKNDTGFSKQSDLLQLLLGRSGDLIFLTNSSTDQPPTSALLLHSFCLKTTQFLQFKLLC